MKCRDPFRDYSFERRQKSIIYSHLVMIQLDELESTQIGRNGKQGLGREIRLGGRRRIRLGNQRKKLEGKERNLGRKRVEAKPSV